MVGIALVLAGCGPSASSQAETAVATTSEASAPAASAETPAASPSAPAVVGGPLKVWLGGILASAAPGTPARQWWDEMTAQFETDYPGTKVETTLMDPDGVKQIAAYRASFGAGQGPDVAMMYPAGFTTTFESSLLDLRAAAPAAVAQFPDAMLPYGCKNFDCSNDAKVLLVPNDFSGWVLGYNKDIFDKVGVSAPIATWDDLLAAGAKLKTAGYTPFEMGNRDGYISDAYLSHMYTSFLVPADIPAILAGTLPLTDPKLVEPLQLWADLYAKGFANEDACTLETIASQQPFIAGTAATVATYDIANVSKAMGDKFGVMPWPAINGSPNAGAAAQVGQGWTIPKFSTNAPLSGAFVTFITSASAQARQFELTGNPPANPNADASKAPDPASGAAFQIWTQDFKLLSLDTVLPLQTQTQYFKETAQALCGQKTPEAAMLAVQEVFDKERTTP
jgi:ABC-type glycerol-3-phosphate transport system substrate-binding protein